MNLKGYRLYSLFLFFILSAFLLSGCGGGGSTGVSSSSSSVAVSGAVMGGLSPISGASVVLLSVGSASPLSTGSANSSGQFTLTIPSSASGILYVEAAGGNSNANIQLLAFVSNGKPSSNISGLVVNELTTSAFLEAMQNSGMIVNTNGTITFSSSGTSSPQNAAAQYQGMVTPSGSLNTSNSNLTTAEQNALYFMGDALASCVENSSNCSTLFTDANSAFNMLDAGYNMLLGSNEITSLNSLASGAEPTTGWNYSSTPTTLSFTLPTPSGVTISGMVNSSVQGPPVSGATVTLYSDASNPPSSTGLTATTASNGTFTISGAAPGTYDLIATNTGYQVGRFQGLTVGASPVTGISLILMPSSGIGTASGNPFNITPTITLNSPTPLPGTAVSGSETFNISASETSGNAINLILLRVDGARVGNPSGISSNLSESIDFSQYPLGEIPIMVLVQDTAHNITTMEYDLDNSGSVGSLPTTTFTLSPQAQTFGQDLQALSTNRQILMNKLHLSGSSNILDFPGSKTINLSYLKNEQPSSTAPNTSISVEIGINQTGGTTPSGYTIYRGTSAFGPFTQIGSITFMTNNCGTSDQTCFVDFDSSLTPDVTYYYQVAAYNSSGQETTPVTTPGITVLPAFHVDLVSPGGPAVSGSSPTVLASSSTSPAVVWQDPDGAVGQEQEYDPYILSQTNNFTNTGICGGNTLNGKSPILVVKNGIESSGPPGVSITNSGANISFPYSAFNASMVDLPCSVPLLAGVIYQWDLAESAAQGSYDSSTGKYLAISVGNGEAYLGGESFSTGSDNGPFFFVTP